MLLLELRPLLPQSSKKVEVPNIRNSTHLGAGIQGFARSLKKNPNTVVKIALISKEDAYEQFLRLCLAHQDNPFFPKIKAVKKYRIDTLGIVEHRSLLMDLGVKSPNMPSPWMLSQLHWMIIIAMERLVPIKDRSVNTQTPQMLKNLYGPLVMDGVSGDFDDEELNSISSLLMFMKYYKDMIIQHTPNKQFRNVLRLLTPLWNKWYMDTKHDNMMIRPTSSGPQLVFLDPVWSDPTQGTGVSYNFEYID